MLTADSFQGLPKVYQLIALEVAAGKSNKTIGKKMNLAPSTVANYLSRTYEQTGCPNRTSLAGQLGTLFSANQEVGRHA